MMTPRPFSSCEDPESKLSIWMYYLESLTYELRFTFKSLNQVRFHLISFEIKYEPHEMLSCHIF